MPTVTARNGTRKRVDPDLAVPSVEMIGPEEAAAYLATMEENYRRIRLARVDRLQGILDRNEWELTQDAIAFDREGRLVNGQHRLAAIAGRNKTVPLLVLRGVAPRAQEVMDTGLVRNFGDRLRREGYTNVNVLGAAINWGFQMDWIERTEAKRQKRINEGQDGGDVTLHYGPEERPTHPQLFRWLARNKGIEVAIKQSIPWVKAMKVRPGLSAACIHRFNLLDAEASEIFVEAVSTGVDLRARDPRLLLRNALMEDARAAGGRRLPPYRVAGTICKAWNYWRQGRQIGSLSYKFGGINREPFPIPF